MNSLKHLMFYKYASEARERLLAELKQTYEPKKADRFNCRGITYEISPLVTARDGLEYEISSKIPVEELAGQDKIQAYFEEVKNLCCSAGQSPIHTGMDDIEYKLGEREVKKRDYIRLRYKYSLDELYDEARVSAQMEAIQNGDQDLPPKIPGVVTVAGRLVLQLVLENAGQYIKENILQFIEANEAVRKKFGRRSKRSKKS